MSVEKMREEFEAWAAEHYFLSEFGPERNPHQVDEYCDPEVQTAWEAWQASRAALVVELPRPAKPSDLDIAVWREYGDEDAPKDAEAAHKAQIEYREECRAAIEAAGVTAK